MLLKVLFLLLIIISFLGYYRLLREQFSIKQEFCPGVIVCSLGTVLLIGGMINLLTIVSNIILCLGIVIFVYYFVSSDKVSVKTLFQKTKSDVSLGIIIWVCLALFLCCYLWNERVYFYDNFSHWALIIKNLCMDNQFPNESDPIIRFQTYPLGTSVVIWYFLRVLDFSEGKALIINSLISLCIGISFFAFIDTKEKKNRIFCYVFAFVGTIVMISSNNLFYNGIHELLVDQLLGTLAAFAFMIIRYYENNLKKAAFILIPVLSFLTMVKNSGILFAIFIIVVFIYKAYKNKTFKYSLLLFISFLERVFWTIYTKFVFKNGDTSQHAVSIKNYQNVFGNKTPEQIRIINKLFVENLISHLSMLAAYLLVLGILYFCYEFKKKSKNGYGIKALAIFIFVSYLVYQAGLYGMYMFSMPIEEAIILPCYFRYVFSLDKFYLCILIYLVINIVNTEMYAKAKNSKDTFRVILSVMAVIIIVAFSIDSFIGLITKDKMGIIGQAKDRLEAMCKEYNLPQNQNTSYILYVSDTPPDSKYRWVIATYELYSSDVKILYQNQLDEEHKSLLDSYDYLIVLYYDENIKQYVTEKSFDYSECIQLKK